jgi:hypothetical protein
MNSIYYDSFCENTDQGDACAVANQAIDNGPNMLGNRYRHFDSPVSVYDSFTWLAHVNELTSIIKNIKLIHNLVLNFKF